MIKLQKEMEEKWVIARTRHCPCVWPMRTFWTWPVHTFFNAKTTGKAISVCDKGDYTVVFDKQKTSTDLSNAIVKKIFSKANKLHAFRTKGIVAGKNVAKFVKIFAQTSVDASLSEYITFFNDFSNEYAEIMRDNMHYWVMGSPIIEGMIKKELSKYNEKDATHIFQCMTLPKEESYSKKIDCELHKLADIAKEEGIDSKKVISKIKKFVNSYFWFPYEYIGPGIWDEKKVIDMITSINLENKKHTAKDFSALKTQKECIKEYSLSPKVIQLFDIIQTLTLMSDDRKRYNSEICYYVNGIIATNLAAKLNITRDEALFVDQELLSVYEKDKKEFLDKLKLRVDVHIEIFEDGVYSYADGRKDGQKFLDNSGIHLKADVNITEVKGQTAYKGVVRGRVRVLKTSHVEDFTDGDILITGMTTPDYVPLMKKASAIVTNEGGITCHAAIISRELKIPCITGAKIATKVFKDGDRIEVDANTGVVRKL